MKCWKIIVWLAKMWTKFCWSIEVWAMQMYVNTVDLVESFPNIICFQKSALIRPSTGLSKLACDWSFNWIPMHWIIRLLESTSQSEVRPPGLRCSNPGRAGAWTSRGGSGTEPNCTPRKPRVSGTTFSRAGRAVEGRAHPRPWPPWPGCRVLKNSKRKLKIPPKYKIQYVGFLKYRTFRGSFSAVSKPIFASK